MSSTKDWVAGYNINISGVMLGVGGDGVGKVTHFSVECLLSCVLRCVGRPESRGQGPPVPAPAGSAKA